MNIKYNLVLLAAILVASPGQITHAQSSGKGTATKTNAPTKTPVTIVDGVAKLTPQNSKIEFIGIHADPEKPDPRLGGFKKFEGEIKLAADKSVESLQLNIDINSVWTQFDKLTSHLKNSEFFDSAKFGLAKFVSTAITTDASGMKVTGNLTLHGVTKEITLPIKGKLDDSGIMMESEFKLDRTMFGMDQMTSGVDKTVSVKFVVGQAMMKSKSMPGPGTTEEKKGSDKKTMELSMVKLSAPNMT